MLVRIPFALATLLFACLLLAPLASAQNTASLSGTVQDTTGAIIPGASVTLTNVASKAKRSTISSGDGLFTINAIQPATYNVKITMTGFDTLEVTGVELHPGDKQSIPSIRLKIGRVDEQVTVSATTAGVNLSSPEKSSLITAEDIKRLSTVGRDVTELIKFLPGFAISTGGNLSNGASNANQQTMGFGSSSVSSFSANGATPQTGATSVISDGANAMDPGDMGASISNVNMDMVAEVKVQTSNFGADSAKGPVVINAVGKSGGSEYHGSAYLIARNGVLNANDWLNNFNTVTRPSSQYFYPGGNIGGPVKIPGTNFNHAKKLTFFTGFEYYKQTKFDQLVLSFIPTARMLTGDLTPASIAAALNVDESVVRTQCPNFYTSGIVGQPALTNSGGFCYSPGLSGTSYTQQGQQIVAGTVIGGGSPLLPVDPHTAIYAKFWPAANRTPRAGNGLASDGYNYVNAVTSTHNGYQYRARVDENFTDNTKLYVSYNLEKINDQTPITNAYYAGTDIIPYPTSAFSNTKANSVSINFTRVFGPTLTNELLANGTYYYQPSQLADRKLVSDAATGWTGGRYYNNGALQLPGIIGYEQGVPDFAMSYFPEGSAFLRKLSYTFSDNLSKQLATHSFKFGAYFEVTANNQVPYNYSQGQNSYNHFNGGCAFSSGGYFTNGNVANSQLYNNVANFLQGCSGFTQTSGSPSANLNFKTLDFYATDEWKATKRLTLTYGIRFDHLGPWVDAHGAGLAVWNAPARNTIFANVTTDPRTYPGISWHQTNSAVPQSGAPSSFVFYSPRAGLAYDLYNNGKTVFRGGWGAYRFHDSYNDSAGALATVNGVQTYTTPTNTSCTYAQLAGAQAGVTTVGQGCVPITAGAPASVPFSIIALDPKDHEQPVTYNYNLTVDQAMPGNTHFEVSYIGNQSRHTFTEGALNNQNYIPLGGLFQPDPITGVVSSPSSSQQVQAHYRPFPNYQTVSVPSHIGYGNYNALQVSLNKQKGAFIFGVNYTWAKALGIRGDYRTGAVGDPSNLHHNYGYLGFNRNNAMNFTYSYQVGRRYRGNKILAAVVNQWEVSGITGIQSGPDTAVLNGTTNTNYNLSGGVNYTVPGATTATAISLSKTTFLGTPDINLQPVLTCNPKINLKTSPTLGRQYINGACFGLPQFGSNGAFNLPDIHGPAYFNSDLTVQRTLRLKERREVQFRMAAFNFLNHPLPQFYGGSQTGLSLGFGNATNSTATTPQQAFSQAVQTSTNFGYTPYKGGYRIVELTARFNF